MMISLTTLLLAINTIILITGAIFVFKQNYVIVTVEDLNAANEALEEYQKLIDEQNAEEEASQERAGGTGFFKECIEDYDDEEEEEDE